jgi:hypothetical protein
MNNYSRPDKARDEKHGCECVGSKSYKTKNPRFEILRNDYVSRDGSRFSESFLWDVDKKKVCKRI